MILTELNQIHSSKKNERIMHNNFYAGIVASFDACFNKKIRQKAILNFLEGLNGFGSCLSLDHINSCLFLRRTKTYIWYDFFCHLPNKVILKFLLSLCLCNFIWLDINPKRIKLRIFRVISIPLYKKKNYKKS